jgi:hypothetical protein
MEWTAAGTLQSHGGTVNVSVGGLGSLRGQPVFCHQARGKVCRGNLRQRGRSRHVSFRFARDGSTGLPFKPLDNLLEDAEPAV